MISYAILKGKVAGGHRHEEIERRILESGGRPGKGKHFHIMVEASGQLWRCPVNIRSVDESEVWFKVRDAFTGQPILDQLPGLPVGLTELRERRSGKTLDYVREPVFDRLTMRHLPFNVAGSDNDVQDQLEIYVRQAEQEPGAEVYVFGSFWTHEQFPPDHVLGTDQGVHDVHMNQGNDSDHKQDDGRFQDGGVIFFFPASNRHVGVFLCFNSQVWFTDNNGHRLPGFGEGPLATGTLPTPPVDGEPPVELLSKVHIVAALLNPAGEDPGLETVTLFNADTTDLVLDGWTLLDRGGNREVLDGVSLPHNEARTITLSGRGAQLGNRGGSLRLNDPAGTQVDTVTWTSGDAQSGRIKVFKAF